MGDCSRQKPAPSAHCHRPQLLRSQRGVTIGICIELKYCALHKSSRHSPHALPDPGGTASNQEDDLLHQSPCMLAVSTQVSVMLMISPGDVKVMAWNSSHLFFIERAFSITMRGLLRVADGDPFPEGGGSWPRLCGSSLRPPSWSLDWALSWTHSFSCWRAG